MKPAYSHTQRDPLTDGQGRLRPSVLRHHISETTVLISEHYSLRNEILSSASQNKLLKEPSRKLCRGDVLNWENSFPPSHRGA